MRPDDYRTGINVMVLGPAKVPEETWYSRPTSHPLAGHVFQIEGVSLPFLIGRGLAGEVVRLDIRELLFARPNRGYITACRKEIKAMKERPKARRQDTEKCGRCGTKCVQRRISVQDPTGASATAWLPWCNTCHQAVENE